MREEQNVGRNVKTYLDSTDLDILEILEKNAGIGVIALKEKLNIKHESLKRHLRKLFSCKLILISEGDMPHSLKLYDLETAPNFDAHTGRIFKKDKEKMLQGDIVKEKRLRTYASRVKLSLRKIREHLKKVDKEEGSKPLSKEVTLWVDNIKKDFEGKEEYTSVSIQGLKEEKQEPKTEKKPELKH